MTPVELAGDGAGTAAMTPADALRRLRDIEHAVSNVVVGQPALMRRLITALFAAIPYSFAAGDERAGCGHVLLEGVPGVAKTLTATTLARLISADFQRIQLTPDLMPADVIGTRIYEVNTGRFRVERGPVFTNILLADEINRATPKTQSALLEAMQERQVTIADETSVAAGSVLGARHAEPCRTRRRVPVAGSAARSVFDDGARGLSHAGRRNPDAATRHVARRARASRDAGRCGRDSAADSTHRSHRSKIPDYIVRLGHATRSPAEVGLDDLRELLVLGLSPRSFQHVLALGASHGVSRRPRLRRARRREGDLP